MSNDFSTLKDRQTTSKIILARLKPGRDIAYDLTLDSGTIHQMTFPFAPLCGIEVNGTTYTKVSGTPSPNQYSYDETTRLLKIELGAAVATFQGTGAIIAYYYLFYTNEVGRYVNEDPEDSTSTMRFWEPRIVGFPSFLISQENVIDGFLSIGNTSLNLFNEDDDFQQYLTDNDSFSRKEIRMWQCLDSTENIQKFFLGICSRLTIGQNRITISTDNLFGKLNDTYSPIESTRNSTYRSANLSFTVRDEDKDKNILKLFCLVSKTVETKSDWRNFGIVLGSLNQGYYLFSQGYLAVNVSYSNSQSITNNRLWAVCIESTASSEYSTTVSGKTSSTVGALTLTRFTVADANKFRPGDNIKLNGNVGFYVIEIDTDNNYIYVSGDTTSISNGHTVIRPSVSVVQVKAQNDGGVQYWAYLEWITHYTIETNDGIRCIRLVDDFEGTLALTGEIANGINPDNEIIFRAWNHDSVQHGDVVQDLLESVGITVNSSSITTANATEFECNFTSPFWDSDKNESVQDILSKLLKSTLGYLSINSSFEIEYKLFADPNPSTDITEAEFLFSSLIQEIDYKDIYSSIEFRNPHGESIFNDRSKLARIERIAESAIDTSRAKYLHGIDKTKRIEHIVLDMTNSKTKLAGILSKRRATFDLSTKGINFSSIIGDDFNIVSSKIIGDDGEKEIKIIEIEKKANETKIKGVDLLGIN